MEENRDSQNTDLSAPNTPELTRLRGEQAEERTAREGRFCEEHGTEKMWANCGNCFEGFTSHDCGEDCCACLYPEDNVACDICYGEGRFLLCPICAPNADF